MLVPVFRCKNRSAPIALSPLIPPRLWATVLVAVVTVDDRRIARRTRPSVLGAVLRESVGVNSHQSYPFVLGAGRPAPGGQLLLLLFHLFLVFFQEKLCVFSTRLKSCMEPTERLAVDDNPEPVFWYAIGRQKFKFMSGFCVHIKLSDSD